MNKYVIGFTVSTLVAAGFYLQTTQLSANDQKIMDLLKSENNLSQSEQLRVTLTTLVEAEKAAQGENIQAQRSPTLHLPDSSQLPDGPIADLFKSGLTNDLELNPEGAITNLDSALSKLKGSLDKLPSTEFPVERGIVLSKMAELSEQSQEKREEIKNLALREMTSPSEPTEQAQINGESGNSDEKNRSAQQSFSILAHQIFMEMSSDRSESLNGTIDAIANQKSGEVQKAMAAEFIKKYPDLEPRLKEALEAQK